MFTFKLYEVYGCDTGCYPVHRATFLELSTACSYAVANKGVISYGLPDVYELKQTYDPKKQTVDMSKRLLAPDEIRAVVE